MSEVPNFDQAIAALTTAEGSPFEIAEREIDGQTLKVFKNIQSSLRQAFDESRLHGDKTFLVYEDETWTFSQVMARVDEIADALVNRYGVAKGDRVAIAMRNYPEWIFTFAAVTSVGGIAVCMNAWWTAEEMAYGLEDSGAKVLMADIERARTAEASLAKFGVKAICVRHEGELPAGVDRLEDVLTAGASMPAVEVNEGDDATILYTSGTTGFPKGAVSSHYAVLNALRAFACRAIVGAMTQPPKEPNPFDACFILAVPLFHVTGLVPVMMSCFVNGIKLVIMYKWTPERALELVERERVTQFVGVPTMTIDLLESPDFESRDTSSLASVGGGGAPAPPEMVSRVDKSFKRARPGLGYGMTETNAYGPQNSGENIYCAEVEAVIYEFEAVHEAAVFGMPHYRLGEEVAVAIMTKRGHTLDVDALLEHVATKLAKFKIPTIVELSDEPLPRNASGKILKKDIRDTLVARRE